MISARTWRFFLFLPVLLGATLLTNSCETDVDILAPRQEVPLIYGLLNQQDTIQYVKINRAFLGDGNAFEMAQIRDSNEYPQGEINAKVEQLANDGSVIRTYDLNYLEDGSKQSGTFYAPDQAIYYFNTNPNDPDNPPLDDDFDYRLTVDVNEGEKLVTGETELVGDFSFQGIILQLPKIGFASQTVFTKEVPVEWVTPPGGKRFQLEITWSYINHYAVDGDTTQEEIIVEWPFPTMRARNAEGGQGMEVTINGEDFFQLLQTLIPPFDDVPNLYKRQPSQFIDIVLAVGGEELDIFMEVAEPATGVAQEKPQYTNLTEGAVGIFSSRYNNSILQKELSQDTMEEIINGEIGGYTSNLGFCDPITPGQLNPRPCF